MMHAARRSAPASGSRLLLLAVWAGAAAVACAGQPAPDPTENYVSVVQLEPPAQPVDVEAPPPLFRTIHAEELWNRAWTRVSQKQVEQGAGFLNSAELLGSGFRMASNFRVEKFSTGGDAADLQAIVAADVAEQKGTAIHLTEMQLIFFMGERSLISEAAAKRKQERAAKAAHEGAQAKAPKTDKPAPREAPPADAPPPSPGRALMPNGGRVVITAPKAVLDTLTNEGRATGTVRIEIFEKSKPGETAKPMATLSTERLRWRTWTEPSLGSTEIAIYTAREPGESLDPMVLGTYTVQQSGQPPAEMRIQGRGMIFESASLDHIAPVYDEDGRTVGGSRIGRSRAIFRSEIRMESTSTTMAALMPFQSATGVDSPAAAGGKKPKTPRPPKPDEPPPPPSRTIVACAGPAILDMAAVPVKKPDPNADSATENPLPGSRDKLKEILLTRRFEFLNNVSLVKQTLDASGNVATDGPGETRMACGHLRIQLAALPQSSGVQLPEFVEASGGVSMQGTNTAGKVSGVGAPAPAQPFSMQCERMFFDGPGGLMFLIGSDRQPARASSVQFEASAQQFSYQRATQTLAMPSAGPKRLVIRGTPAGSPAPAAPAAGSMLSLTQGDTIISWNGLLSRELVRLPRPGAPDRIKEVLTFKDSVSIEQPNGSLRMKANYVKVVRDGADGPVEYLEGLGGVDVTLGDQRAVGERVTVEMEEGPDGTMVKDLITIVGNRADKIPATLIKGGSGVKAERFLVDRRNDTFRAMGGAVAVVKREGGAKPAEPKPQAAQDATGLFKGISLQPGSTLFIQCDGEFGKDGKTNQLVISGNVIVRQTGLTLQAGEVVLDLDTPAAVPGRPAGELFSADPSKIRCRGAIELITQEQWVQCDELEYDVRTERSLLKMADPENDVRIYMLDAAGGSRVLCVRKQLEFDGASGKFLPGGPWALLPYLKNAPAARDAASSPARRRSQK